MEPAEKGEQIHFSSVVFSFLILGLKSKRLAEQKHGHMKTIVVCPVVSPVSLSC